MSGVRACQTRGGNEDRLETSTPTHSSTKTNVTIFSLPPMNQQTVQGSLMHILITKTKLYVEHHKLKTTNVSFPKQVIGISDGESVVSKRRVS